jgi:uncharacterized protein DUF4193
MTVDYDAPRRSAADDVSDEPLDGLGARRADPAQAAAIDVDDEADAFELPDADLSGEELSIRVIPKQANEFTCSSCFLVHHRSRLARQIGERTICADCA